MKNTRPKIEEKFMRGTVAKRIFFLFIVAAFLPALALAVLSYSQVRDVLVEQSSDRLSHIVRNYALSVYERMLLADNSIKQIAFNKYSGSLPASTSLQFLQQTFSNLTIVGPGAQPVPILGKKLFWPEINKSERAFLAKGNSILHIQTNSAARPSVLLIKIIDANQPDNYALIGELNPSQLWGHKDSFPYMTDFCALSSENHVLLFCSKPYLQADISSFIEKTSVSSAEYQPFGEQEISVITHRQLFLKPKFHTDHWDVIAIQPKFMALMPVTNFSRILVGVIVLTLLLVILLSISQIRRTMGPLEKMIKGTRKLANENFEHRVVVSSQDEFGELAGSFNEMAGRLGRQHGAFKVLSSIDQAILTRRDIDPVIDIVLERIRQMNSAEPAGVTILETSEIGKARTYTFDNEKDNISRMTRVSLTNQDTHELVENPKGLWLASTDNLRSYFPSLVNESARKEELNIFALPIFFNGDLYAIIWMQFTNKELAKDILLHLRELGDRVGVALSAADRDEQLIYQARHDDLTGLPNRFLFKERLLQEIAFAQRQKYSLALFFIDLDRFKTVNDSFGHSAGDELLVEAGQRLRHCVRKSDLVSRLGGDEFAVILTGIKGVGSVTSVAENIIQAFSEPFFIEQQPSQISASIGITIYPTDGNDSEDLLKKADTAMYRAKDEGRNRFVYFEEQMNSEAVARTTLERELRQAVSHDQLFLHYQPQLDLRTGKICGAEALIRWNHPVKGLISPAVFIPLAEEIGLIEEIGKKVIYDACMQYAAWKKANLSLPRIAVNVSGLQFRNNEFVQIIKEILNSTAVPASALELEVTESLFIDKNSYTVNILDQLRQMGILIAIDDFGTGYSSMSYLKQLPVDILKIDKSFVDELEKDDGSRLIAHAIISLSHILGKMVVAEGVETAGQLELLRKWECDAIQGYYFSRPLTPKNFIEFAQKRGCYAHDLIENPY
ncbi:MAG: EAL domain-containing protein [Gammaproteobacteria bacterium]